MDFTIADRESKLWQKLKAHLERQLQTLRALNDAEMPEPKRNILVGRIQEVKALLALEHPAVVVPFSQVVD